MTAKIIFLICCLFILTSAIIPPEDDDQVDLTYSATIRSELATSVSFKIPNIGEWSFLSIATSYYGDSIYWPLLRAANPNILRSVKSVLWAASAPPEAKLLTPGMVIVLPSLLTCVEFLPLTCVAYSLRLLRSPGSYIGNVTLDYTTQQMYTTVQEYGLFLNFEFYSALNTLQITQSWITQWKQPLYDIIDFFSSSELLIILQNYPLYRKSLTMMNMTIINEGDYDFTNFQVYQPNTMGQSTIPTTLKGLGGSISFVSVENDDFGGTSGMLFARAFHASGTDLPGLIVQWEVKNSEVFPNRVTVDMQSLVQGSMAHSYAATWWNTEHLIDESVSANTMKLSNYEYSASVQISHSRHCQVIITLTQNLAGVAYESASSYNIQVYPRSGVATQSLWLDPPNIGQLFTGVIQAPLLNPPQRNQLWKFYEIRPNIYNIYNQCNGAFILADTTYSTVSMTAPKNRTTDPSIQWNILPVPGNSAYVIIQSVALDDQCLTAFPEWNGFDEGDGQLPVYMSECSFSDFDQLFKITVSQAPDPNNNKCPLL